MKRNAASFAIVLVFVTLTLPCFAYCQNPVAYTDPDAFNVYLALMPTPINGRAVLVVDATRNPERCSLNDESIPDPDFREAMHDFHRANKQVRTLARDFRSAVKAELIHSEELKSYFRKSADKGWKAFYKAHPQASGTIAFSAVGFNHTRTAALVYSEIVSCSECGVGDLARAKRIPC
jgi:hypothetical protein